MNPPPSPLRLSSHGVGACGGGYGPVPIAVSGGPLYVVSGTFSVRRARSVRGGSLNDRVRWRGGSDEEVVMGPGPPCLLLGPAAGNIIPPPPLCGALLVDANAACANTGGFGGTAGGISSLRGEPEGPGIGTSNVGGETRRIG